MDANKLYQQIQDIDIFENLTLLSDFNFTSATLHRLLPNLTFDEQIRIARQSGFYQLFSPIDEKNYPLIKTVPRPEIDFQSYILVTYHVSSYRILNSLLISWGIPFKLVADKHYIDQQGEETIHDYYTIANELGVPPHNFEILDATNPTVLLKCRETIKSGYMLIFYADGNSGVGGMNLNNKNMVEIPFLSGHMFVRKGIAVLAALLKMKILPCTVNRNISTEKLEFNHWEPIKFPQERKNEMQIMQCVRQLFQPLETLVSANPGIWEGWNYYHNFIDFNKELINFEYRKEQGFSLFNHIKYGIGILPGEIYYLMDKSCLKLKIISPELFQYLLTIIKTNHISEEIPALTALYHDGVLRNRLINQSY